MMLDASLSCAGLPALSPAAERDPGVAPWGLARLVIEGGGTTSDAPSTYSADFFSYRYQDDRPGSTVAVRAQESRAVGTVLDDDGNTLMGNVAEDMAYAPDLVAALIGASDLAVGSAADYRANLVAWRDAVKAERPACRIAWSAPLPYNPDQSHPGYAAFTAQRAILMEDARDPAVWGQWADYYLPLAEHPDWAEIGGALYGDGVHPTGFDAVNGTGGQNRLYDQFKAAMDTLADPARAASTKPYESVWPGDETDLAVATPIVRRFIMSGLAHEGIAGGVSASGGDAAVSLNGAAYSDDTSDVSSRLYNGDVIDLKLTTSGEHEAVVTVSLTIGGETREIGFTTEAAEPAPSYAAVHLRSALVAYSYGSSPANGTEAAKLTGLACEDGDKIVIYLDCHFNGEKSVTAVTANGGTIAFTPIGATPAGSRVAYAFYADTAGLTSLDLAIAVSGSTRAIHAHVFALRGAQTGGPDASSFERRAVTNEPQHDVDGGLSLPAGGSILLMVGSSSILPFSFTGATAFAGSALTDAQSGSAAAEQTEAGNVTVNGKATGGLSYTTLNIVNTAWAPA
jgi:hypothetical protein